MGIDNQHQPKPRKSREKTFEFPCKEAKALRSYLSEVFPEIPMKNESKKGIVLWFQLGNKGNRATVLVFHTDVLVLQATLKGSLFEKMSEEIELFIDKLDASF